MHKARGQRACGRAASRALQQIGEHTARAQPEQRNRNCQKGEVIEEHDRKQPGQRQFQQQRGEAGEREPSQQSFSEISVLFAVGVRVVSGDGHIWIRGDSLADERRFTISG